MELKAERPKSSLYPNELVTYGDHIRARRLDAGLSQRQAAEAIGVDETSVFNWETNRVKPAVRLIPGIIRFLGYCPYVLGLPLSGRLRAWRQGLGLSQEMLAKAVGVDEGAWRRWEVESKGLAEKYLDLIKASFDSF